MSFFQKMMRINQSKTTQSYLNIENLEEGNQLENQSEFIAQKSFEAPPRKQSVAKAIEEDDQLMIVPQQPKISLVYPSVKANLIVALLPKKQQLLRDMLGKKRQFDMKKISMSDSNKRFQLKKKLEQSSLQFMKSVQSHKKVNHLNRQTSNQALQKSYKPIQQSIPIIQSHIPTQQKLGVSRVKHNKRSLKQSQILDLSQNSTHKPSLALNLQQSGPDIFGRQIMMRLLNLLENERNDRKDMVAMSMNLTNQLNTVPIKPIQKQKQAPIIINNIMKTPVQSLNKDIFERQMKIRMLENNRSKHKNSFNFNPNIGFTQLQSQLPRTQRSQYTKCNEFNATVNQRNNKVKISLQCSRISIESKKQLIQNNLKQSKVQQITKPSSNFNSQMNDIQPQCIKQQRKRSFNRSNNNKKKQDQQKKSSSIKQNRQKLIQDNLLTKKNNQINDASAKIAHKASIRIDIPLNQDTPNQGLTLAQAFKRKIGKLKSQTDKQKNKKQKTLKTLQKQNKQNDQNMIESQMFRQYKTPKQTQFPILPLQNSQTINLTKQLANSKKTQKPQKINSKRGIEQTSSKKSRQPSKDLIDRLIGGQRAKVSKKQMYALTKKNYENLPQIQAKKKQQQKLRLQKERLIKIRQLQRSTRTLKQAKIQNQ